MNANNNPVGKRCLAVLAALCLVSLIAHLALFPALPEVVPTHFGVSGEVDGWSDKRMALLLDALPLVLLGLFWLVPRIDPKGGAYAKSGRVYQGFVTLFTLFMIAMTWTTEAAALGWLPSERAVGLAVPVFVGVMLLGAWQLPAAREAELHVWHQDALGPGRRRELAPYAALWRGVLHGLRACVHCGRRHGPRCRWPGCVTGPYRWRWRGVLWLLVSAVAPLAVAQRLAYLTSMSSYSCVPRPIFSAWSMQLFQSVSGCVT